MPTSPISTVIQNLRQAALLRDGGGLTDSQLLGLFVERHDDAAFAALVTRHGGMVWGVCRRLLSHHDAEDAFQATFLVLARKAASVVPRKMVGNWLHGLARQTALQARRAAARRRRHERQATDAPHPAAPEPELWRDLRPLLDEELSRLPDRYRAVVVLCDLEGHTRHEAARHLGVPEGTVAGWLARARAELAKRLARRGVTVPGAALAAVLAQDAASSGVPPSVATGAASAQVITLTKGVLKAMLIHKLKTVAAVLMMGAAVASGTAVLLAGDGSDRDGTPPDQPPARRVAKVNRAAAVAWGREVDGLQAGVGLGSGADRGDDAAGTVRLVVKVRNVGQSPVTIQHLADPFESFRPIVRDKDGKQARVFMPPRRGGARLRVEKTLNPGEEVEIGQDGRAVVLNPNGKLTPLYPPRLAFADPKSQPKQPNVSIPTVYAPPGAYRVSYQGFIQSHPKLATGELTVKVSQSGAKSRAP